MDVHLSDIYFDLFDGTTWKVKPSKTGQVTHLPLMKPRHSYFLFFNSEATDVEINDFGFCK